MREVKRLQKKRRVDKRSVVREEKRRGYKRGEEKGL